MSGLGAGWSDAGQKSPNAPVKTIVRMAFCEVFILQVVVICDQLQPFSSAISAEVKQPSIRYRNPISVPALYGEMKYVSFKCAPPLSPP